MTRSARAPNSPSNARSGWLRVSSSSRYVAITSAGTDLEAPREQAQDVERRFVGPVDVLDQNDGGPGRELADELGRERVRLRPTGRDARQLPADAVGDLEERAKRARCVAAARTRRAGRAPARSDALNESTSAVLPIPASPRTSASFPRPVASTSASAAASASSSAVRSRSSNPDAGMVEATSTHANDARETAQKWKYGSRTRTSVIRSTGRSFRPAVRRIASGLGAS